MRATYLVAGPDLVARAVLTSRRADLEGHTLTVSVGRDDKMEDTQWPAAEKKKASDAWSLPPTP